MLYSITSRRLVFLPLLLVASGARAQAPAEGTTAPTGKPQATGAPVSSTPVPPEAVWYVSMDVKRFVEHPLGQQALGLLQELIREETNDFDAMLDLKTAREKLGRVIGFDPLGGIASVTVYGLASPFAGEIRNEEDLVEKMAKGMDG